MRFVKQSEYFENWGEAIEAVVEIWTVDDVLPYVKLLAIVLLVPVMLVMCTLGLRPGGAT